MSWTPIAPTSFGRGHLRAPITASTTAGQRQMKPGMTLMIRLAEVSGIDRLAQGAAVTVELGEGDHAGMLRLKPGGDHILKGVALAKPKGSLVQLRLPLPPRVEPLARPAMPCTVTEAGGWVVVQLPSWANPPRQPTSPERGRELAAAAAAEARRRAGA